MQPSPQPQYSPHPPAPPGQAQPPALAPGTILLDRYLIQGYISGGGFGHIYKVLDNALGYRRALKEAFYQDPLTRYQFHLEAEFLLNTRHPNLLRGYAVFEQSGRLYLVMDYVDGHTLEEFAIDHIRRTVRPLPEARVLDWVLPVCGALHTLHTSPVPIIHRDVKPANVKITRSGVPILIDLGLAKLYAPGTQTIGAALAFTPGYAPPEQYRAVGATDARTDIYGIGASLFYLLTGYQPTEAPARIGALALPPLRQLTPTISALTERAVLRAMELDPAQRQQSALELEHALRAAREALRAGQVSARSTPSVSFEHAGPPASASSDTDPTCVICGAVNRPAARHCMRCGALLTPRSAASVTPAHGDPSAPPSVPGATPTWHPDAAWIVGEAAHGGVAHEPAFAHAAAHEMGAAAAPRVSVETTPHQLMALAAGSVMTDLAPEADWVPDQPAIVMPPLRRGPAPAATPLQPAAAMHVERAPNPAPRFAEGAAPRPAAAHAARFPPRQQSAWGERSPDPALVRSSLVRRALPSLRRWHLETLNAAPATEAEARTSIAAVMALVLAAITLAAIHNRLALATALPALALGHWCLRAQTARPIPEARWFATLALVVTYAWLALYTLILALHRP